VAYEKDIRARDATIRDLNLRLDSAAQEAKGAHAQTASERRNAALASATLNERTQRFQVP
jgi:hypothetical protein